MVSVAGFRETLRGTLIQPHDTAYHEARAVWNGTIDRHPAVIATFAGTADVIASVNFAREHDLEIAVRGGGHNVAGTAVCDDGIVIDLSEMRTVWVAPTPYLAHQSGLDSTVPHGWRYYWKSSDLPALSDDLIDVFVDHAFSAASPRSYSVLFHLGGAVSRVDDDATAYTGRNSPHNVNNNGVWRPDEAETYAESETVWTRRFFDELEPHREGVYVNFLDVDDGTQRVRESYGEHTYRRLAEIKSEYDPDNVFHRNQNIEPAV